VNVVIDVVSVMAAYAAITLSSVVCVPYQILNCTEYGFCGVSMSWQDGLQ